MTSETRPSFNAAMKGVPAFLRSLYHMVDDDNNDLIHWSDDGESFFIRQHDRFAKEVLGAWFKHTNYSSFVRQLNNYGFHKLLHLQQGSLHSNGAHEYHHYEHPDFRRGREDLLGKIQRKGQSAPDEPIKYPQAHNQTSVKKEDLTTTDVAPVEDCSQNRLIAAILLEVEGLKRRQIEQDRENQILRDKLDVVEANMARHQDVILRLLASFGVLPKTDHNWAPRGHGPLMIQGIRENEATKIAGITTADDSYAVSSVPSDAPFTVSDIHDEGDNATYASQNSPIFMDRPPSPPLSPSSSVVDSDQFEFISLEDMDIANCDGSEKSTLSAALTDYSLDSLHTDHLFPYSMVNSKFIDSSAETVIGLDQTYGMDEIDYSGTFHNFSSSPTLGSSTGSSTLTSNSIFKPDATSSLNTTTDITTTSFAKGDSTLTTVSAKGTKRKKDLMDELRTGCAPHPPVSSLSLHDTQSATNSLHRPTLLRVKDELPQEAMRSTLPQVPFTFDTSITKLSLSGDGNESRSPKRARSNSADHS